MQMAITKSTKMIMTTMTVVYLPDCYPDHALAVVEELDCLCVEREVVSVLVVEEVDGVLVQPEGERLQEGDVVGHHLLVREIKLENPGTCSLKNPE